MPRLRLDVDEETWERVVDRAEAERRPPMWQAEVLLRQAVGLPFPRSESSTPTPRERGLEAVK
jgi:hypothetical protein